MGNKFYNTSDTQVVVDAAGHFVDGRSHIDDAPDTKQVRHAVEAGLLIEVPTEEEQREAAGKKDEDDDVSHAGARKSASRSVSTKNDDSTKKQEQ